MCALPTFCVANRYSVASKSRFVSRNACFSPDVSRKSSSQAKSCMARPSKESIANELQTLADLLAQFDGAPADVIASAFRTATGVALSRRTLQRRLEQLERDQWVRRTGDGKSTRYHLNRTLPVGYAIDWLHRYRPGVTWYLTPSQRDQLHRIGRLDSGPRPAGTFARDILNRLLIDLSWASSRLEGNTYSRLDTRTLIEFGQGAEGKEATETQMILNHKRAIEFLVEEASTPVLTIHTATLRSVHALLAENLLEDRADEGRLRERPVQISGSRYIPTALPPLIHEAFERIATVATAIPDPFEQAFFLLVHLPYLQPFVDVNKRTSRLAANLPLLHANLAPLSFVGADAAAYIQGTLAVYERRTTDALADFFMEAYRHSARQYVAVKDAVVPPDPLRLRYRSQLHEVVRAIIAAGDPPALAAIRRHAEALAIDPRHQAHFHEMVLEALVDLNEGSAVRYRVRPSEWAAWKKGVRERACWGDLPPIGAPSPRIL